MKINVLTLEFRRTLPSLELSDELEQYFAAIAASSDVFTQGEDLEVLFSSIPVDHGDGRYDILTKISGFLEKKTNQSEVFIVDAVSHARKTELPRFKGIQDLVARAVGAVRKFLVKGKCACIVLVDQLRPEEDRSLRFRLSDLADTHRFSVVDQQGRVIGGKNFSDSFDPEKHHADTLSIFRYTPSDVEEKLVDRVGFFKISGPEKTKIITHFYDCAKCTTEIAYIVTDWISDRRPTNDRTRKAAVLLMDVGSYWISRVALELQTILSSRDPEIEILLFSDDGIEDVGPDIDDVFVVFPFLESGEGVKTVHKKIYEAYPSKQFQYLSVLTSKKPSSQGMVVVGPDTPDVKCIVSVPSRRNLRIDRSLSEIERYGVVDTTTNLHSKGKLTSIEFWMMAVEAGIEYETAVPKGRFSMGYLPNLKALISQNSRFVASELVAMWRRNVQSANRLLVAPDEETAAPKLCKALEEMYGIQFVTIPRKAIDSFSGLAEEDIAEMVSEKAFEDHRWYRRLSEWKRYNPNRPVNILDEIRVTGATAFGIQKFLGVMGIDVASHLVAIDFMPLSDVNDSPAHVRSLYSISLTQNGDDRDVR